MNHKAKNILIVFLFLIIISLLGLLFDMRYERNCIPDVKGQKMLIAKDSGVSKTKFDTSFNVK